VLLLCCHAMLWRQQHVEALVGSVEAMVGSVA
jgi:hypothetical protein